MKQGFVKVAAVTPNIRVADIAYNTEQICIGIDQASQENAKVVVFPELCVTGYTCGDLFLHETLLAEAEEALREIAAYTKEKDMLVFVGLPFCVAGKIYNVAAALNHGKILGFTTKVNLSDKGEFNELRYFAPGPAESFVITFDEDEVFFGPQILYQADTMKQLVVTAEICSDMSALVPPSVQAVTEGATIIVNCAASDELVGKKIFRAEQIKCNSARMHAGYVYANAGSGESTTDLVFGGHNLIAENGVILSESVPFSDGILVSEIDVKCLLNERRKNTLFPQKQAHLLPRISFKVKNEETELSRTVAKSPFIPEDKEECKKVCEEILTIQAHGLKKRLEHAHAQTAVVGISGGLDSTLALIVTAKAFELLGKNKKEIIAVTMPCFGTTDRTYQNACRMSLQLGATLREVPIADAVNVHFRDIGHNPEDHSVTFENAQARERTQVLMDIANQYGGMVIGTGDMSELALGWATYNGDHMSMYGVNGSVPKTMMRYIVRYAADTTEDKELRDVLYDVLDTPVSPELLPPKDGDIAQKTEDLVGPYELHDFFMYYLVRYGFEPSKVYRLARYAFGDEYDDETVYKWLRTFCWRFFSQQFKRSCLPDGPKIGVIDLSPRGGLKMPSDACVAVWMKDLENVLK
ncbi:MAG: NAD(+) synthase [Schaedlerella sp.]|nr:NAD(+) synthase [Schaedlerella sp.]